ncbi:MAG: GNAT family N-acetyltransferase [Firmicutes bacterium]|nr:GNAT family N-acetyltransferase [Bacillota bacterium]
MSDSLLLFEVPEELVTERLVIRTPLWGDGQAVHAAIMESMEALRPWMPWASDAQTVEETEANVRAARLKYLERTDLRLHLFDQATGDFVGSSGLHRIDWNIRRFEIGYWIRTSYGGRGLMTEAVAAITRMAEEALKANRIEIRCDARNLRSARIAQRVGFTLEGVLRANERDVEGQLRDTMVFARVRGVEY